MTAYAYAGNANLVNYSKETILAFNARTSLLLNTTHREFFARGLQAVFLVADSGKGYAQGRAPGGDIIPDNITTDQIFAQFDALFAKAEKPNEEIDFSQANWIKLMIDNTVSKMHRTNDKLILDALDLATTSTSVLTTITLETIAQCRQQLVTNYVPNDQNLTLACGPALFASLTSNTSFNNALYTSNSPRQIDLAEPAWKDQPMEFKWQGMNIVQIPFVPFNSSTDVETNFIYHKNAIGSAVQMNQAQTAQMYNDIPNQKQVVVTPFLAANKILQDSGIIKIPFNAANPLFA